MYFGSNRCRVAEIKFYGTAFCLNIGLVRGGGSVYVRARACTYECVLCIACASFPFFFFVCVLGVGGGDSKRG